MATRQIPWARVFAEGVAIVVSILLAFGIQTWWDNRTLSSEIRGDLLSIDQELEDNLGQLDSQIALMNRIVAAGAALVVSMENAGGASVPVQDSLLWLGTGPTPTFNPSTGAVEALLASGRLSALANPHLRTALAGMDDVIADAAESQVYAESVTREELAPLVDGLPAMAAVLDYEERRWDSRRPGTQPTIDMEERLPARAVLRFPSDQSIRGALRRRRINYVVALAEMADLRETLLGMRSMIAEELPLWQ